MTSAIGNLSNVVPLLLRRACDRIAAAPPGQQRMVLEQEAFDIGRLVALGGLDRAHASYEIVAAAQRMVTGPRYRPRHPSMIRSIVSRAFRDAEQSSQTAARHG